MSEDIQEDKKGRKNMRKIFKKSFCFFIVAVLLLSYNVFADSVKSFALPNDYSLVMCENSRVVIAEGEFDVISSAPVREDNVLMLPLRTLFEKMGYTLSYDNGKCTLDGDKQISVTMDSDVITVDNEETTLSAIVKNIDGSLYAPSDIAEVFGKYIKNTSDGLFILYTGKYYDKYEDDLMKLQGVYVQENGKDTNNGFSNSPVATLDRASKIAAGYAKAYGFNYPVHIFVKGGKYRFSETLKLDSKVFGSENFKGLKIVGYDGEVEFTGSTKIPSEKFKPVTDASTLARLPKAGRGRVAYVDLNELGVTSIKKNDSLISNNDWLPYLYLNDKEQVNARWPNTDFATVYSVPQRGSIGYSEANCNRWEQADDLRVTAFFGVDYEYRRSKIQSVDTKSMTLIQKTGEYMMPTGSGVGKRWYASNLLEEIDLPGEWYVDRTNNVLYYYPPYTLKNADLELVTLLNTSMFDITGCRNITFSNIKFAKVGGKGIVANKSDGLSVLDCKFQHIQDSCITVLENSFNFTAMGNEVYMCHTVFADMLAGNIVTAESGNFKISNNRFINVGIYPHTANAVFKGGLSSPERVGNIGVEINNNVIQDCANAVAAINVIGANIKIHHNEIVNHARHIKDGGAIYQGRTNSFRGNDISFNYIHDFNKDNFYCGIYSDDGSAGGYWHHNITKDINRLCIVGAGPETQFMYNLAINNKVAGTVGDRMSWSADLYGNGGKMQKEVEKALENENYANTFPQLKEALKRDPFFAPYNGVYFGNVGINAIGESGAYGIQEQIATYGAKTIERNGKDFNLDGLNSTKEGNKGYVYSDDYFQDPENEIWDVKEDSQLAEDYPELLEIKTEEIGIEDEYSSLLKNEDSFKLIYPSNGLTGIQPKNLRFSWELMQGAGKYKLVVATDPELTNVVLEKTVYPDGDYIAFETSDLELDSVYYWKVYAEGMARQSKFIKESNGVPYCFKTAKKEEFSKDNLKLAIDTLNEFSESIKSGDYEYEQVFVDELEEIIKKSEEVYRSSINQDEVDETEEVIYAFIKRSPFYMKLDYKSPSFITDSTTEWTTLQKSEDTVVTYNKDGFTITPKDKRGWLATKSDIVNEVVCFNVKFDNLHEQGSKYQGFDYRLKDDSTRGYLFIVKENIFEMQTSHGTYYKALPNFNLKAGQWCEVQLGAVTTPTGVLFFATIDGKLIFAELDQTVQKVTEGGRFAIRTNDTDSIHIKPATNIPEKQSLIEKIYSEWEYVDNVEHYACLLDGTVTALGLNNSMYASVDKTKLAEKLWPLVESGELKFDRNNYQPYVDKIFEKAVLEAYNQGKNDLLLKNGLVHLYNDYVKFENIDQNGVTLHSFAKKRLSDSDRMNINTSLAGGECNSYEELRARYAQKIFVQSINSFGTTFVADPAYMTEVFTDANMKFIGFDISEYSNLSDTQKEYVHANLGGATKNGNLSYEKIVEVFNSLVKEIQQ